MWKILWRSDEFGKFYRTRRRGNQFWSGIRLVRGTFGGHWRVMNEWKGASWWCTYGSVSERWQWRVYLGQHVTCFDILMLFRCLDMYPRGGRRMLRLEIPGRRPWRRPNKRFIDIEKDLESHSPRKKRTRLGEDSQEPWGKGQKEETHPPEGVREGVRVEFHFICFCSIAS